MAILPLHSDSATSGASTVTTLTVTPGTAPTAGNPVTEALSLNGSSGGSVTCVGQPSGNSLTVVVNSGSNRAYYAYGVAQSGDTSYKWTWTTARKGSIAHVEWTGALTNPSLVFGNTYAGDAATSATGDLGTATQSSVLSIASWCITVSANDTFSNGSPASKGTVVVQQSGGAGNQNAVAIVYTTSVNITSFNTSVGISASVAWSSSGQEIKAPTVNPTSNNLLMMMGCGT